MQSAELVERLSPDGQLRLRHFLAHVVAIIERRASLRLRDWIEGAWQQLDGPAALTDGRDLEIAAQFFTTLDQYEEGGDIAEAFLLHQRLADRQEQQVDSSTRVHVLTLFKAKGLEYDTVILPALDGITRRDDKPVMAWHLVAGEAGEVSYLMAPIEPAGEESDPVHRLISQFAAEQASFELDRLLYVATTRAKKGLHVYFGLKRNKNGEISTPQKGTLLHRLWPAIATSYESFAGRPGSAETREDWVQPLIRRFPVGWASAAAPAAIKVSAAFEKSRDELEVTFDWAGSVAMRVGSVVHSCLQHIAEQGSPAWQAGDRQLLVENMLLEEGVAHADVAQAAAKVWQAINTALDDEKGRWILADDHTEAVCEYPVTLITEGRAAHFVIDRSFIDAAGDRWIIDYKTSSHEGGNVAGFVDSEVLRYQEQLDRYRDAMRILEPQRNIRTALYFPLLGIFRELS
jgi:ATP-dependent exoDNAse (exonuclease V) beta subunit